MTTFFTNIAFTFCNIHADTEQQSHVEMIDTEIGSINLMATNNSVKIHSEQ